VEIYFKSNPNGNIVSVCAGGLTENDFIFAAKVDQIDTKDLSRKNRTWF
jgi:hypothetical protein